MCLVASKTLQMCAIFSVRHKQTRHQFYLQLRKDLLDDRLSCHEETALYLGALALQTEYGDCMPEVSLDNCFLRSCYRGPPAM